MQKSDRRPPRSFTPQGVVFAVTLILVLILPMLLAFGFSHLSLVAYLSTKPGIYVHLFVISPLVMTGAWKIIRLLMGEAEMLIDTDSD